MVNQIYECLKCPICYKSMGGIYTATNAPFDNIDWCPNCNLEHHIDNKYWKWNNSIYNEEQFNKVLKLKAFW